jgi:hypothetical protein
MEEKRVLLVNLVDVGTPAAVLEEVRAILGLTDPGYDFSRLERVFADITALYAGSYPGYRECTTDYHDLRHTMGVFLAFARLAHGAQVGGISISPLDKELGLIATLFHDAGYIQSVDDVEGTGGKYTIDHVERSIDFLAAYAARNGFSREEETACREMIASTAANEQFDNCRFSSPETGFLARMTATADYLGQIADNVYLEKLLFLFREFQEAGVLGFASELELLQKTASFYRVLQEKLEGDLENVQRFMAGHFRSRCGIEHDLYREAIQKNIDYLELLLVNHEKDYRNQLRRGGVVERLRRMEAEEQGRGRSGGGNGT